MTTLRLRLTAARELGLATLFHYARFQIGLATGWIRSRTPVEGLDQSSLTRWLGRDVPSDPKGYVAYRRREGAPRFFIGFGGEAPASDGAGATTQEADEILSGAFRLFGKDPIPMGMPPDWFAYPPPLQDLPRLEIRDHWSRVPLDAPGMDVRLLWELSRFGWVFPLTSAFRRTGDVRFAEGCWTLIDDWRRRNPPNQGVHWASGQEVGLRILALTAAIETFGSAWAHDPPRLALAAAMVASHASRIPPTVAYAQAQGNNHLLSEGAGLLTAGLMFPEFRRSRAWARMGRDLLENGFRRQTFDDGGYVQHSVNYHALALELGLWSARLAELNHQPLTEGSRSRLAALADGLSAQVEPTSGRAPSFGPDDGSRLLLVGPQAPSDRRPVLEAAARAFAGVSWFPGEDQGTVARWLGLGSAPTSEVHPPSSLPIAGLHFLRNSKTRAVLRCVRFRGRPGHSDQLHVDLWRGSENVVIDPGSYLYNGPAPWSNALSAAAVHNGPVVDGQEPMHRAGRFLWAGLSRGSAEAEHQGSYRVLRSVQDGYRRLGVRVERAVATAGESVWVVQDRISGEGQRRMTVGWTLPDGVWEWFGEALSLATEGGPMRIEWDGQGLQSGLVRAGVWLSGDELEGPVELWGWRSPHYGALAPCLRLVFAVEGRLPLRMTTRFLLGDQEEGPVEWSGVDFLGPLPEARGEGD